jgi:hypothetical protein
MAITLSERILDLALSGHEVPQIAVALNISQTETQEALRNLNSTPSPAVAAGAVLPSVAAGMLGNLMQAGNSQRPARTNFDKATILTDGALAATGVGCFVPIPVAVGDVFGTVAIQVGGTAAVTPTHQIAALYKGTGAEPALIGQSKDTTSAAIAASSRAQWALENPVTIKEADAPHGFIYAEIALTAGTIPTAAVYAVAAGLNYQWAANCPLFTALTAGSALAGAAAAKIESAAAKAAAPAVILF